MYVFIILEIFVSTNIVIIVQGDEDLVSEFVANEGLGCLLDVGQKCDQTCQQYILKGEHLDN